MKTYQVIKAFVSFDLGTELELSKDQAEARISSLEPLADNIYQVKSPVQFKFGERLGIYEAFLTKALLENLQEISNEESADNQSVLPTQYPAIEYLKFGKARVYDQNKNLLTPKPIKKDEAEKLLTQVMAQVMAQDKKNDKPSHDQIDQESQNRLDV